MTTLQDRPHTALLVVDVQQGVVAYAFERDAVVENINRLVGLAREQGVPVIWVQHCSEELVPGSDDWQIAAELAPENGEARVEKEYGDAFEATDLERVLAAGGIGRVIVVGAQTDACVRSTIHGALVRGYDVTLVTDAHTTEDLTDYGAPPPEQVIAHTNLYWEFQRAPGRTVAALPTAEVTFR